MKKKHHYAALTVLLAAATLTACGSTVSYKPERSGVFIQRDGGVESAEVETFDNAEFVEERYKEDELLTFIEDTVTAYNLDTCGIEAAYREDDEEINVGIVELTVKDSVATLILDYVSAEEYVSFNEADDSVTKLEYYSAPEAVAAGISLEDLVNSKGETVDTSSIQNNEKYHVVVISGSTEVVLQGKITGYSGEAELVDSHTLIINSVQDVVILFK